MRIGVIKWYDVKRGYGFIQSSDSEKQIFLHYSAVDKIEGMKDQTTLKGKKVSFNVTIDLKNRQSAIDITLLDV